MATHGIECVGTTTKKSYSKPQLTQIGGIATKTQGMDQGPRLDEDFPVGTPDEDLTFS